MEISNQKFWKLVNIYLDNVSILYLEIEKSIWKLKIWKLKNHTGKLKNHTNHTGKLKNHTNHENLKIEKPY